MPRASTRQQVIHAMKSVARHHISHSPTESTFRLSTKTQSTISTLISAIVLVPQLSQAIPIPVTLQLGWLLSLKHQRGLLFNEPDPNDEPDVNNSNAHVWLAALEAVENHRYYLPRKCLPNRKTTHFLFDRIMSSSPVTFLKVARMSKESFFRLLGMIYTSHVFQNNSPNPQAPVELQLLVTLANLGLSGNGGQLALIGHLLGVSEGSVENYTWRCIAAILQLQNSYLKWPSPLERSHICTDISQNHPALKGCVGFIEGTLVPLAFGPVKCKEDYWTRKYFYGVNSMIVCDNRRRIIFARHGWCGSVHDQRVFRTSSICCDPSGFFTKGEYLVADSGYSASSTILPLFKRGLHRNLSGMKASFNKELSAARTVIEHVNGMLKSRFQKVKECRLVIRDERSVKRLNALLMACCLLHNFLLSEGEFSRFPYQIPNQQDDINDQEYLETQHEEVEDGRPNNEWLRNHVFELFCRQEFNGL